MTPKLHLKRCSGITCSSTLDMYSGVCQPISMLTYYYLSTSQRSSRLFPWCIIAWLLEVSLEKGFYFSRSASIPKKVCGHKSCALFRYDQLEQLHRMDNIVSCTHTSRHVTSNIHVCCEAIAYLGVKKHVISDIPIYAAWYGYCMIQGQVPMLEIGKYTSLSMCTLYTDAGAVNVSKSDDYLQDQVNAKTTLPGRRQCQVVTSVCFRINEGTHQCRQVLQDNSGNGKWRVLQGHR